MDSIQGALTVVAGDGLRVDILRGEHVIGFVFVGRPTLVDQYLLGLGQRRQALLQQRIDQLDALLRREGLRVLFQFGAGHDVQCRSVQSYSSRCGISSQ